MKSAFSSALLFLASLPVIAATQETNAAEGAVEPLGTAYLVVVGLIFIGVLAGFYRYYMRWDGDDDTPDSK